MLNELYDTAEKLAESGIKPKDWHKEYRPVRKPKLAFFVFLDQLGDIHDIERVNDPSEVDDLYTWESKGDLRQSFPYFNIPPLYWIQFAPQTNEDDKIFAKDLKANTLTQEQLRLFCERINNAETTKIWPMKSFKKLHSCLEKGRSLRSILSPTSQECLSIMALIDRLGAISAETLYEKLLKAFTDKILNHPETAAKYFDGLYYSNDKEPGNSVTVLFELADGTSRFEYPVKHQKVRDWINRRLLSQSPGQDSTSSGPDIFGNSDTGWEKSFDDVQMKNVLGNVKLRAMASAAFCQHRYGKADAESCPVGQESRSKMKGALEWLTHPSRKGKTWDTVARAADNEEILLSYPSVLPQDPPALTIMFGGGLENETDNTGRFENCAQNVTETLLGLMAKNQALNIRVFVLRKMDLARRRVSDLGHYSAQHLISSAKNWQIGCRNLPLLQIKQFTKEKKTTWGKPEIPFPMEVVWVLNTLWSRDGETAHRVKGTTTQDGVSLLLAENSFLQQVLHRALYRATHNTVGLVLALGQAHAQGQVFTPPKNYARHTMILPSILGLFLFKLNITKEDYMKSPPYLIGRLLSLADQLHYYYCQHVRNNSIPPQLMGNALMPTALEEPSKALSLFSNRILPYQAWAKTVSGDPAGLARYFLSELGKVSSDLGDVCSESSLSIIPERCTDADKAQMMIGYLARPEKSDSETTKQGDEK